MHISTDGPAREVEDPAGTRREIRTFLLGTFAVTWGLAGLLVLLPGLFPGGIDGRAGQVGFVVAVFAPTVVGLSMTLRARGLRVGLREVWAGVAAPGKPLRWLLWFVVAMAIVPVSWLLIDALSRVGVAPPVIGSVDAVVLLGVPGTLLLTTFVFVDYGALGEEYGWRGYLLPRLLASMDPIRASVCCGLVMAVWHLPSFFLGGLNQASFSLPFMLANWIGWSILATWIYLRSKGNWFLAGVVPHAAVNAAVTLGGAEVDAIYGLGALLAAALLVLLRGYDLDADPDADAA